MHSETKRRTRNNKGWKGKDGAIRMQCLIEWERGNVRVVRVRTERERKLFAAVSRYSSFGYEIENDRSQRSEQKQDGLRRRERKRNTTDRPTTRRVKHFNSCILFNISRFSAAAVGSTLHSIELWGVFVTWSVICWTFLSRSYFSVFSRSLWCSQPIKLCCKWIRHTHTHTHTKPVCVCV